MDWWWIPIGLAAWLAVSVAVALRLGPALRRCSQARKTLDRRVASWVKEGRRRAERARQPPFSGGLTEAGERDQ
jgi:hypothetical protein